MDQRAVAQVSDSSIKGFFGEYRFLSNFHLCEVPFQEKDGTVLVYPSTEHAYMAQKTDSMKVKQIFALPSVTPSQARELGQQIKIKRGWDNIKWETMFKINLIKYRNNPDLGEMLLSTGDKLLEETNWWGDTYWGVCDGVGENNLGKILMSIRKIVRGKLI